MLVAIPALPARVVPIVYAVRIYKAQKPANRPQ